MGAIRRYRSAMVATLATLVMAGLLGGASAQAQTRSSTNVKGEFIQAAAGVTGYDPQTGVFTAVGIATVNGDWTGYWYEEIEVTTDPLTGDASGTVRQTFTGTASDGTSGSLDVLEYFTIDGSNHQLHGEGKILGGTGDWEGSLGYYWVDGLNLVEGFGTWRAHWVRPN